MNWIKLTSADQLNEIKELSKSKAQVIFKHSTRCGISSMAKNRLERDVQPEAADFYFLDLIRYRSLSDKIAEDFSVYHQSPQVLLIKNMECVYDESHSGIQMAEIVEHLVQQ
ncbi:MAG TPA: bacillithiol system redox-active protein YtxJ [Ferruginibacter sp.]|nr:bacillithiol system redox-active protein YtxJ [Ferruginibacter sp.]